jgi:hypothetical protein
VYLFDEEVLQDWDLSVEGNMWQFSASFEGGAIDNYLLLEIFLEVSLGHINISALFLNFVVNEYVNKSFDLMTRNLQFFLNLPYIFFS